MIDYFPVAKLKINLQPHKIPGIFSNIARIIVKVCGDVSIVKLFLYVIRQTQGGAVPEGQVSFVPGGDHWEFGWTYEGSPQAVAPYEDSTRLTVPLLGNGLYTFTARKDGVNTVQERFYVFYDFMDFKITLTDVLDCEYITIHIDYLYIPDFAGFPGGENVDYWVDWDGKERQLSSMNDYRYEDLSQAVAGCAEDVSCRIRIKDRFDSYGKVTK